MTESTKYIKATPVISAAVPPNDEGGQYTVLPFYAVDLYDGHNHKRVYANYTFGKRDFDSKHGFTVNDQIGEIKLDLFKALSGKGPRVVCVLSNVDPDLTVSRFQGFLHYQQPESLVMLVLDREVSDEKPFFQALNIMDYKDEFTQKPEKVLNLRDIGMTVEKPFVGLNLETQEYL